MSSLSLSPLVSDGAVLQRDRPVRVWGQAEPVTPVTVCLVDRSRSLTERYQAVSDAQGYWELSLAPHEASAAEESCELAVSAGEESLRVGDLVFGDVWLLGGQSNMQLWMSRLAVKFPHEIEQADDDRIRLFQVPQAFDFEQPHDDVDGGRWEKASRDDISLWSGVGYFFAKRIRRDQQVPVGLLSAAIGGTLAEAWLSREDCQAIGALPDYVDFYTHEFVKQASAFFADYDRRYFQMAADLDTGLHEGWAEPDFDDSGWEDFCLTTPEAEQRVLQAPGVSWLRKRIDVPPELVGQPGELRFGTMRDSDTFYVDGRPVGSTGYQYPPRNYAIGPLPASFSLAIRLTSEGGQGGFHAGKRHLIVAGKPGAARPDGGFEGQTILDVDAMGPFKVRRATFLPPHQPPIFFSQLAVGDFNAMIHPLRRFALAGALWYQGESNSGQPQGYAEKFRAVIRSWRRLFDQADLPFIFAQLPNFGLGGDATGWAEIRSEQRKALAEPGTGMAITLGLGEDEDLHPLDKQGVADRLALCAQALYYGSAPLTIGPDDPRAGLIELAAQR